MEKRNKLFFFLVSIPCLVIFYLAPIFILTWFTSLRYINLLPKPRSPRNLNPRVAHGKCKSTEIN
tara:strand:+ start:318 stop:512 length:195 start_codon:yes stop_codon:yes gene_type:complete